MTLPRCRPRVHNTLGFSQEDVTFRSTSAQLSCQFQLGWQDNAFMLGAAPLACRGPSNETRRGTRKLHLSTSSRLALSLCSLACFRRLGSAVVATVLQDIPRRGSLEAAKMTQLLGSPAVRDSYFSAQPTPYLAFGHQCRRGIR